MNALKTFLAAGLAAASLIAVSAQAAISAEEAARLGGPELTPMGAERKANADGSIPAWTGEKLNPPAGWKEGDKLIDPFAADKPLFEITAKNVDQYKDKLSVGQIAMFKRYPDFRMPVYQSRRTSTYPQRVYDEVKAGAVKAELVDDGNGMKSFASTTPFPIPKVGVEVIWNHISRFRGYGSMLRTYTQIPVQANGAFSPVVFEEKASWGRDMYGENTDLVILFLQKLLAPPRLEGEILLVHETMNQTRKPRQAWIYNAGQRRVRKAPDVAYDGPGTASDGLRTSDDLDLFNGSPDRYTWELKGKKELYIPYNAYRLIDGKRKYADMIKPGHLVADPLRYELHRVWVVDAKLKPGARHIYARRTFYVDEDTWQISIVDHYDGRGELWKLREGHTMTHYDRQVPWLAGDVLYDLLSGRYLVSGLDNEMPGNQYHFDIKATEADYTPAALRRSGRR